MKYPGVTIFLLFFGISLLDALWNGALGSSRVLDGDWAGVLVA